MIIYFSSTGGKKDDVGDPEVVLTESNVMLSFRNVYPSVKRVKKYGKNAKTNKAYMRFMRIHKKRKDDKAKSTGDTK